MISQVRYVIAISMRVLGGEKSMSDLRLGEAAV
jgi:hypothetical protein